MGIGDGIREREVVRELGKLGVALGCSVSLTTY